MKLSVIIPCYNSRQTLALLLESIKGQTEKGDQVIVVDDGSDDGSSKIASSFDVMVHETGQRKGPAVARNLGAKNAAGEILVFLDADVIAPEGLLSHIRTRFEKDPNLDALSGVYDASPANSGFFHHIKAAQCVAWFDKQDRFESLETACCGILKTVFNFIGGFNEEYAGADVEDYEFGYRLGHAIELDKKMAVRHHFPDFWTNTKNYFMRSYQWAKLYVKRKKFDSAATTPGTAFSTILPTVFLSSVFVAALMGIIGSINTPFWIFTILALASLIIWCGTKGRIIGIIKKKFGMGKALGALPYLFISDLAAFAGGALGIALADFRPSLKTEKNK